MDGLDLTAYAIAATFLAIAPAGAFATLFACCLKLGWM